MLPRNMHNNAKIKAGWDQYLISTTLCLIIHSQNEAHKSHWVLAGWPYQEDNTLAPDKNKPLLENSKFRNVPTYSTIPPTGKTEVDSGNGRHLSYPPCRFMLRIYVMRKLFPFFRRTHPPAAVVDLTSMNQGSRPSPAILCNANDRQNNWEGHARSPHGRNGHGANVLLV